MNSVYNKPAQEVAPTGPPGKVPGLPRLRTSVSPGTFPGRGGPAGAKRLLVQACCKGCSYVSTQNKKIKRFLLEGISAAYGFESKWVTHLVYAQICVTPVRRAFEGFASISEAHLESFCAPNE